jgi:hypothetical protein
MRDAVEARILVTGATEEGAEAVVRLAVSPELEG